jgi:KAP family P-loop domain
VSETIDEIWEGDLLGRKAEASHLIAYMESLSNDHSYRDESKAFTIAVDAGYGEGKTWFLKRLAKQLELNHPVAFVDAWQDDLADEPLTALVATLKKALQKHFPKQAELRSRFDEVLEKTGSIAKITAKGLLKRGAGLLITTAAVDQAEAVFSEAGEAIKGAVNDGLKEGSQDVVDGAFEAFENSDAADLMKRRVADFEAGQKAIADLKVSLTKMVEALKKTQVQAPIVIIVDELDRCRPTYALKLLEEIKHLFDIPGILFVLGMNSDQLSHSVAAAYGQSFNGTAYLSRFVGRRYSLTRIEQKQLITHLLTRFSIPLDRLAIPDFKGRVANDIQSTSKVISRYVEAFRIGPRDTIQLLESLKICLAITQNKKLFLPLILPLLNKKLKSGQDEIFIETFSDDNRIHFHLKAQSDNKWNEMSLKQIYEASINLIDLPQPEFDRAMNQSDDDAVAGWLMYLIGIDQLNDTDLAYPRRYRRLVETVGRFTTSRAK